MPLVKLSKVVSCSSERPDFPADSLIKGLAYTKWKCAAGSKQAVVVIELDASCQLDSIDVGNECSAFVEIFVGRRTGATDSDFQVLVPATSFMNPTESRNEQQINRVKLFKKSDFVASAAGQKWDLLKIVCSQPFNRQLSYGLSFIRVTCTAPDAAAPDQSETKTLGRFTLKPESEVAGVSHDPIGTGALFRQVKQAVDRAQSNSDKPASPAANGNNTSNSGRHSPLTYDTARQAKPTAAVQPVKPATPVAKPPTPSAVKTPSQKRTDSPAASAPKRPSVSAETPPAAKRAKPSVPAAAAAAAGKPAAKLKTAPFSKLLDGVTFVLSGYQNPRRGRLRASALAMGARYSADWHPRCTHLVCAFNNTPKHNQVRGTGAKVVTGAWIEQCHAQRKRLHWRDFCLDKKDATGRYSDEEIQAADESDSGADSDEEVQRVLARQHQQKQQQQNGGASSSRADNAPANGNNSPAAVAQPPQQQQPELDEDGLPVLPDWLDGLHFFILKDDVSDDQRRQLGRIICTYAGELCTFMGDKVTHVLCAHRPADVDAGSGVKFVRPQWLIDSAEQNKLVDITSYLL